MTIQQRLSVVSATIIRVPYRKQIICKQLHTLMMGARVTKTCRWTVIYDKTYFSDVHFLVCYTV